MGQIWGAGQLDHLYLNTSPLGNDDFVASWLYSPGGAERWIRDDRFDAFPISELCQVLEICDPTNYQLNFALMDVNGDGASDLVGATRTHVSTSHHADLVREMRNGRGGTISLKYTSDVMQRDGDLEDDATGHAEEVDEPRSPGRARWTTRPVVESVTVSGHGFTPSTTSYRYADPRWCPGHRSSLGFRLVERTRPDASVVERYFWQRHGRAGETARVLVKEGTEELFRMDEVWELPDGTMPGSIDSSEVNLGRLVSSHRANRYGGALGAEHMRTITYDDGYGYHFASRIDDVRATGTLSTILTPLTADTTSWLIGLVAERKLEDGSATELARSAFTYTNAGALATRTDYRKPRGGAQTPTALVTQRVYDSRGNLKQETDPKNRVTHSCYDGAAGEYHASCPTFAVPQTYSVRTGVVDALGKLTSLEPDPASGQIVGIDSSYTDQPKVTYTLDPFSRVTSESLTPEGGSALLAREIVYGDVEPAYVEENAYTGIPDEYIRTAVVTDGFGGTWKTIEDTPNGTEPEYRGTIVHRDPSQRLVRETLPLDCDTNALCSQYTGATEGSATLTFTDALGRPVEGQTPDATGGASALFAYRQASATQPVGPGAAGSQGFDVVLAKNAKGDLVERWLDGDRVVWVNECENGIAPNASLSGVACSNADQTFYTYEATGEISTLYDAVATASSTYTNADHYLRYHFDTLGQVVQIDDPDGGTSQSQYDKTGNLETSWNGRGQATLYAHDDLDRLTGILPQVNGEAITITYREDELQRESVTGTMGWIQTFTYDDLGRLSQRTYGEDGWEGMGAFTLLLDFEYDLLGRTTRIVYPDDATIVAYEYAGAYLEKVCEVPGVEAGCDDPEAIAYVTDVAYDSLGRRTQVSMPPGARSYQYSATTQRVVEDRFDAVAASGYWIQRDYGLAHTGRDPIGNLVEVQGGTSESGDPVVAATFGYDRRNRLASWSRDGVTEHYSFDTLGNLVGYATANPGTPNQTFGQSGAGPHAVTTSTASGSSLTYAWDGDGNLASALGGPSPRHYGFDWANRLVKVGATAGSSSIISVGYDADGMRVRDFRPGEGQRIYVGEHATFHRDDVLSETFRSAEFHISAFGQTLAYKRVEPITLRTEASIGGIPLRLPEPLLPIAMALLVATSAGGLLGLVLRLRLHVPIARHPALAGSAWTLVLLLAIPPLPARSGGGGPGTMRRWLVTDHLGSGSVWLDEDGARVRHTEYAPFGRIDAQLVAGDNVSPWYYAGHRREHWSGLDYMQARWYSPATGTFVGVDPVVSDASDPQAFNAYAYARNSPLVFVDPTGAFWDYGGSGPLGIATWGGIPSGLGHLWQSGGGGGAGSLHSGAQILIVERDGRPEVVLEGSGPEPMTIADLLSSVLGSGEESSQRVPFPGKPGPSDSIDRWNGYWAWYFAEEELLEADVEEAENDVMRAADRVEALERAIEALREPIALGPEASPQALIRQTIERETYENTLPHARANLKYAKQWLANRRQALDGFRNEYGNLP